jgi:hypothetical protein
VPFHLESFQNRHLPPDGDAVDAIVTVSLDGTDGAVAPPQERVIGFIADDSGSMEGVRIEALRHAIQTAIDELDAETTFFVVAFNHEAEVIAPPAKATSAYKDLARRRVAVLHAAGGTAMSSGLEMALTYFRGFPRAINQAVFITDGKNESERIDRVRSVLSACTGVFACDCWGIGTGWQVGEVQEIARALDGKASIIPEPSGVAAAFRAAVAKAQSKAIKDVRLRLWTPMGAELVRMQQVNPTIEDLAGRAVQVGPLVRDYPTGAWANGESRDYHVTVQVQPGAVGDELLACRPSVVFAQLVGSTSTDQEVKEPAARIFAAWTADDVLSSRLDPHVAHYTGQDQLAAAIQQGLEARDRGDAVAATQLLGRAVQLAHQSGSEEMTSRLRKVVDIDDPAQGTVRLKQHVDRAAAMDLQLESTTTKRARRAPAEEAL